MKIHFTLAIPRVISFFSPRDVQLFLVIRPVKHKDNLFRSSVKKSVLLFNTYYAVHKKFSPLQASQTFYFDKAFLVVTAQR